MPAVSITLPTFIWTRLEVYVVDHDMMDIIRHASFVGDYLELYHSVNQSDCRLAPSTDLLLVAEQHRSALLELGIGGRLSENPQQDFRRGDPVIKVYASVGQRTEDRRLQHSLVVSSPKYCLEEVRCT